MIRIALIGTGRMARGSGMRWRLIIEHDQRHSSAWQTSWKRLP